MAVERPINMSQADTKSVIFRRGQNSRRLPKEVVTFLLDVLSEHENQVQKSSRQIFELSRYYTPCDYTLCYDAAISVFIKMASFWPTDEHSPNPRPVFDLMPTSEPGYCASVVLPQMAWIGDMEVRRLTGPVLPTKKLARQGIAYYACIVMHANSGCNDRLSNNYDPTLPSNVELTADNEQADMSPVDEQNPSIFPNPFGCMRDPLQQLFLHKLRFTFDTDGSQFDLGLITANRIESNASFPLDTPLLSTLEIVDTAQLDWPSSEREQLLAACEAFTATVVQVAINRRPAEHPTFHCIVPVLSESTEIDWPLLRSPLGPIVDAALVEPGTLVIAPYSRMLVSRIFTWRKARPDLCLSSPLEAHHPTKHKKRFWDYEGLFLVVYQFKDLPPGDPIVQLSPIVDLLSSLPEAQEASCKAEDEIITLSRCRTSNLPWAFWQILHTMPEWIDHLYVEARIRRAVKALRMEKLDPVFAQMALTLPSCGIGRDYESLETLGDCYLKLAVSVYLFQRYPDKVEGPLAMMRTRSTDNQFLRKKALELDLASHMISERFQARSWTPTSAEDTTLLDLGRKLQRSVLKHHLSDSMEALIGAGWLSGPTDVALEVGTSLKMSFGGSLPWHERPAAIEVMSRPACESAVEVKPLEIALGYTFRNSKLLQEALSHSSCAVLRPDGPTYERLGFLGDAILDMYTMEYLMNHFGPFYITPSQLSRLKAICVCNGTAGYLAVNRLQLQQYIRHAVAKFPVDFNEAVIKAQAIKIDDFHEHCWTWEPPKTLCDVFKALIAAVFVDSGFRLNVVFDVLRSVYGEIMPTLRIDVAADPASRFRELICRIPCRETLVTLAEAQNPSNWVWTITMHGRKIASLVNANQALARQLCCKAAVNIFEQMTGEELQSKCTCSKVASPRQQSRWLKRKTSVEVESIDEKRSHTATEPLAESVARRPCIVV